MEHTTPATATTPMKRDEPGILSAAGFLAVVFVFMAVVAYAFVSASYVGPVLAFICGVAVIALGVRLGHMGEGEPGNNAARTAIILVGIFLLLVGGAAALAHALRSHF